MDKVLITFTVFLDFGKAFDSINNKILLDNLEHYGIRGPVLQLFKSYLSERTQFVYLHNSCSNKLRCKWCSSRLCAGPNHLFDLHKQPITRYILK